MSLERKTSESSQSPQPFNGTGRDQTPSPVGVRHRPPVRVATRDSDVTRRASFFSEGLSETQKSFRVSTDNLLLPRIDTSTPFDDQIETSHWQSVPLGLALLPAVGGLFFKDGSHVVTDVTLLVLAAIFLNWALRLPWEWYKAAQSTVAYEPDPQTAFSPIEEEDTDDLDSKDGNTAGLRNGDLPETHVEDADGEVMAAQRELRLHELLALLACFIFPMLGAWLLHAIRSQLSRPSEGLVSNYNLTIFLLVAEMRPMSHAIKLVQKRTLYLQRKVNNKILQEHEVSQVQDVSDITKRLEELEAHVASAATAPTKEGKTTGPPQEVLVAKAASQAGADLRKAFQPELDALNRAMRRYEKRMTITAIQVESRLQDLETRLKDVVVLAAAAQRSADKQPRNYTTVLANWLCAAVVIPTRYLYRAVRLPGKLLQSVLNRLMGILGLGHRTDPRENRTAQRNSAPRPRAVQKKGKAAA